MSTPKTKEKKMEVLKVLELIWPWKCFIVPQCNTKLHYSTNMHYKKGMEENQHIESSEVYLTKCASLMLLYSILLQNQHWDRKMIFVKGWINYVTAETTVETHLKPELIFLFCIWQISFWLSIIILIQRHPVHWK